MSLEEKVMFLKLKTDINIGIERFRSTPGAVLLDVRTPEEYLRGNIPGSTNLPLNDINNAREMIPDTSVSIFVYCQYGGRAKRAVKKLKKLGYQNAECIGGISSYKGR